MGDMIKMTQLWKNKDKSGRDYFVGFIGAAKVFIFEDREPDDKGRSHTLYIAPVEPKKAEQGAAA